MIALRHEESSFSVHNGVNICVRVGYHFAENAFDIAAVFAFDDVRVLGFWFYGETGVDGLNVAYNVLGICLPFISPPLEGRGTHEGTSMRDAVQS